MNIATLCLIFFARIVDVSCNTIRIIFIVKGQRFVAACIGFFEVMVYMLVLGRVLGGGKTLTMIELVVYCGGFATGNYVGSWLEEKLMNTFILVEAIMDDSEEAWAAISAVRDMGLGATVINGMGLNGPKLIVKIFCRRNNVNTVQGMFCDHGFVSVSDVKRCSGGWFPKRP